MTGQTVLHNIPRVYTAVAEWSSVVLFVILLKKKYSDIVTAWTLVLGLVLTTGIQLMDGILPRLFWIPGMILAIVVMILLIKLCCDITGREAVYHGMRSFILAEFAASLEWQLYYFLIWNGAYDRLWVRGVFLFLVYGGIYAIAYIVERKALPKERTIQITNRELLAAVLISILVFTFSNLSFLDISTPFSSNRDVDIFNIRTLVDFSGYLILILYHVQLTDMFVRYERDTMETMLHSQVMQYKLSRESIDLVNRKYHDLKHQISVLRSETDDAVRNAYLDHMEKEIKIYEAQYKTGNKILDTILTSQNLYCMKHGIDMVCVADGALLNFMEVMDICTIFGNALDNAVECELKIEDKKKRMINLKVFRQKQFAIIGCMNYCEDIVQMKEGLPLTSKKDHAYHGFGVKSIQAAAQKYDGTISVSVEKNWFRLLVMIPLKNV